MAIIKCPECGHEISDKAPFCPSCGIAIAGKVVKCPECGKVYFAELGECPQCHAKVPETPCKHAENIEEHNDGAPNGASTAKTVNGEQAQQEPECNESKDSAAQSSNTGLETGAEQDSNITENAADQPGAAQTANRSTDAYASQTAEHKSNNSARNTAATSIRQHENRVGERQGGQQPAQDTSEQETEKHSGNNRKIIYAVIATTMIVLGICYYFYRNAASDREQQAYEYAMSSKDMQVLEDYLQNYSDAPEEHIDSIQAHLDMLKRIDQDWTNAMVSGSKSAFEQYIKEHPDSPMKAIAIHKIDSIDWAVAQQQNSVEAMEMYIEQHPDGDYIDDANALIKSLNSKTLQPEERQIACSVMDDFFNSLNKHDEIMLSNTVNPLLTQFLGKTNATKNDVVTFMNKIYKDGMESMNWQPTGSYTVSKKDIGDQQFEYHVANTVTQTVTMSDNTTTVNNFRITATVNNEGKISEFNMVKIVE